MQKKALVTGGARGIGAAICRALAADAWDVIVHYHSSKAEAHALAAEIGGVSICADLRDVEQIRSMFDAVGEVGLLVNNAGIAEYGLFTDLSPARLREIFAVNVDAMFHCTQCALPGMLQAKQGVILNISSIWGMVGASCEVAYSSSKAAVIGFTKALAKELAPSGIRVNCVAPGVIETEMLGGFSAEELEAIRGETPLGMLGMPSDVCHLVAFLVSEQARFMTGQVISPNGGLVI